MIRTTLASNKKVFILLISIIIAIAVAGPYRVVQVLADEPLPTPTDTATPTALPPTPTDTATPTQLPPTPTDTATPTQLPPTPTDTATPTQLPPTPTDTATPTQLPPTPTDTATPTQLPPTPTDTATPTQLPPTPTDTPTPVNNRPEADANGSYLGMVDSPIVFDGSASFDPDGDMLTYAWDWGDGSSSLNAGATPTHTYSAAGIYSVCLTVTDPGNLSDMACTMAVVYDPDAGFVTGGGWIDSPAGAFKPDPDLTGKANFGFVSKYKKGANIPNGITEFQFHAAGMNFHSESYKWLVVNQNGTNAQFKGEGTINGGLDPIGNAYKFMLWAGDGSPDTFRIKIWYEDGTEVVVYDNGFNQALGGGSIVVHTKK